MILRCFTDDPSTSDYIEARRPLSVSQFPWSVETSDAQLALGVQTVSVPLLLPELPQW